MQDESEMDPIHFKDENKGPHGLVMSVWAMEDKIWSLCWVDDVVLMLINFSFQTKKKKSFSVNSTFPFTFPSSALGPSSSWWATVAEYWTLSRYHRNQWNNDFPSREKSKFWTLQGLKCSVNLLQIFHHLNYEHMKEKWQLFLVWNYSEKQSEN